MVHLNSCPKLCQATLDWLKHCLELDTLKNSLFDVYYIAQSSLYCILQLTKSTTAQEESFVNECPPKLPVTTNFFQ